MREQETRIGGPAIVTDGQAIRRIILETVREAVSDLLPELVRQATIKPYLTVSEVEKLTGWSRRRQQYLRDKRRIEFQQDGRKILYPTDALFRYLRDRHIRPANSSDDHNGDRGGTSS
jgi:Arc/MetJ family transcription regulator